MSTQDLKTRLDALEQHISKAETHLKDKGLFSGGQARTASELRRRYEVLSETLRDEFADAEAHGHHVSDIEKSVRGWLDALELRMD